MLKLNLKIKNIYTKNNEYSNTTLVKVKFTFGGLNYALLANSNTTLVKVKFLDFYLYNKLLQHSNTTLVKVKY